MTEIVGDWLHFDGPQPKKRRAQVTCVDCHSRKVKCDLQKRTAQGQSGCTNCVNSEKSCHLRPSKRTKRVAQSPPDHTHEEDAEAQAVQHQLRQTSPSLQALEHTRMSENGTNPFPLSVSPREQIQQQQQQQQQQNQPPQQLSHQQQTLQAQLADSPGRRSRVMGGATAVSNPSDVDTGFLQIYGPENQDDAEQQESEAAGDRAREPFDTQQSELQEIFAETYFDFCYPWCPVLDRETLADSVSRSPLLANALAVASSHIRPPLLPHEGPEKCYKTATSILYNDEEIDGVTTLQAISLFYWWAPRPPTTARRHSSWWWTSVLIRHAQQMNYHREPGPNHPLRNSASLSLRRRIWWTAFARERLTALCQSKPCIIDPDDCNIQEPTLADFPNDPVMQRKGEIFIYWVRLCAIMGRIAKTLSRSGTAKASSLPSITELRQEVVDWVHSLPPHLQLPIGTARTRSFDRDVHQLYLPYLTTIIILHLRRSSHALPQALPPAILAGSCIVRILKDILSRGDARFLMAITCWYSGTAFIALLQACRIENLVKDANEGLDVLTKAVEQLQRMWGSANVIRQGFDRLRDQSNGAGPTTHVNGRGSNGAADHSLQNAGLDVPYDETVDTQQDFDWTQLFPFVTRDTSSIAAALLPSVEPGIPTRFPTPEDMLLQDMFTLDYQGLLDPLTDFTEFGFMQ